MESVASSFLGVRPTEDLRDITLTFRFELLSTLSVAGFLSFLSASFAPPVCYVFDFCVSYFLCSWVEEVFFFCCLRLNNWSMVCSALLWLWCPQHAPSRGERQAHCRLVPLREPRLPVSGHVFEPGHLGLLEHWLPVCF